MTTRYRITAEVARDGQTFTTEPEFGASVDEAKANLLEVHGAAFVGWHDLFQVVEVRTFGCVRHCVTQMEV